MASSTNSHGGSHKKEKEQDGVVIAPATSTTATNQMPSVISRRNLQLMAKVVDPNVQLDEETEDTLMNYADEVLEQLIEGACELALHRKSTTLEAQDVQTFLERQKNLWTSSDTKDTEPIKVPKKIITTDAHKQRLALIKKNLKKYWNHSLSLIFITHTSFS